MRAINSCLFFILVLSSEAFADPSTKSLFVAGKCSHVYSNNEGKLLVCPVFEPKIDSLGGGLVFNMELPAKMNGVILGKEEFALFSPYSQLFYFEGSPERLDLLRQVFEEDSHGADMYKVSVDLSISKNEETVAIFEGVMVSGRRMRFSTGGGNLEFELTSAGENEKLSFVFNGEISIGAITVKLNGVVLGDIGAKTELKKWEDQELGVCLLSSEANVVAEVDLESRERDTTAEEISKEITRKTVKGK